MNISSIVIAFEDSERKIKIDHDGDFEFPAPGQYFFTPDEIAIAQELSQLIFREKE